MGAEDFGKVTKENGIVSFQMKVSKVLFETVFFIFTFFKTAVLLAEVHILMLTEDCIDDFF